MGRVAVSSLRGENEIPNKEAGSFGRWLRGRLSVPCGSPLVSGHIREISLDLAVVDWVCEDCGHKWSNCCPFRDGVLTT